jgi:hypothetical protein
VKDELKGVRDFTGFEAQGAARCGYALWLQVAMQAFGQVETVGIGVYGREMSLLFLPCPGRRLNTSDLGLMGGRMNS